MLFSFDGAEVNVGGLSSDVVPVVVGEVVCAWRGIGEFTAESIAQRVDIGGAEHVVGGELAEAICRDVADHYVEPVAHGFEERDGQPFVGRWKYEQCGVGKDLVKTFAADKACEDGSATVRLLFKHLGVVVGVVGIAGDDEFVAFGVERRESVDEHVEAFLFDESTDGDDIFPACQAEAFDVVGVSGAHRRSDAVVDEVARAVVFRLEYVADYLRDDDNLVAELRAAPFAGFEHRFGEETPLFAVVVGSVVGCYHFHSENSSQRCHKRRTDGVDVDDVGIESACFDDRQEGVDDGFEALAARRIDVDEFYAFIFAAAVFGSDVATAADYRNVDAQFADAWK